MGLSLTDSIADVRLLALDTDATDQSFTDAQITSLLNRWYLWWYGMYSTQVIADATTLSFDPGNTAKTWAPAEGRSIAGVMAIANAAGAINVLKRTEFPDIYERQQLHVAGSSTSTNETGLPTEFSLVELSTGAGNAASPQKYSVYVYPVPTATTTISMYHRAEPDHLIIGGNEMRLTDWESYAVTRLTALDCSALLGAPDAHIQMLARSLPDDARLALKLQDEFLKPSPNRPNKTSA